MNMISCHEFVKYKKSSIILSCHIKLVDYYLCKRFVIHYNNSSALNNVPRCVKKIINVEHIYKNNSLMTYYRAIPSDVNNLKSITIYYCLHTEFSYMYYNYKGDGFIYIWENMSSLILIKLITLR